MLVAIFITQTCNVTADDLVDDLFALPFHFSSFPYSMLHEVPVWLCVIINFPFLLQHNFHFLNVQYHLQFIYFPHIFVVTAALLSES